MYRIEQSKMHWMILLSVVVVGLILSAHMIYAQPTLTGINGKLTASFSNEPFTGIDTSMLESRIQYALNLIENTDISENGMDIPRNREWVNKETHDLFQDAVETAIRALDEIKNKKIIGIFAPNDTFKMTIGIEKNTGFANMALRVFVPEGLELINVETVGFQGLIVQLPPEFTAETITPIVGPEYAIVTSFGGTNFNAANSNLLVYTFRVVENTGIRETLPLTVTFANRFGAFIPTDMDGVNLDITLPDDGSGVLGSVIIR